MIVGRTVWTQSTSVTDGRTDGRTDRQTDRITITKTVPRRASHGKNETTSVTTHFYRAMHFSAFARSWDRMSSVCPSVCNVGDL